MPASNLGKCEAPLELGFIGGGLSSAIGQAHFAACQLDGRWKLVAGAFSRREEISKDTAQKWNIPAARTYKTWQEMVCGEKEKLDAVVILTPPSEHAGVISGLIKSGIPVICEKPLVGSLTEVLEIYQKLQDSPGFLSVTYNYSGYPMVRELQARVQNGELGNISKLHFEMPQEGFTKINPMTGELMVPQPWRLEDGSIPTICHDLGVHLHHLGYFITGKLIKRTISKFSNHSVHRGIVDNVMMWLEYEDGMEGSFWISKTALGHRNGLRMRLYGTKASAEWIQSRPEELFINYDDGTKKVLDRASQGLVCGERRYDRYRPGHPSGFIEAFGNLYFDMANAVKDYQNNGKLENPYVFGIEHSIRDMQLFTAAKIAHETNQWVDLGKLVAG